MFAPQHAKEAMTSRDGPPILTGVLAMWMVKLLAGWCVIARSPHGRIVVLFGPVITAEAHLAFSGARTHSNNTAEMTAMIEALSFLGPRGLVARDANSCNYYDSKHAAGVSWAQFKPEHMSSWHLLVSSRC